VWSKVRVLYAMDSIPPWFIDVTTFITLISKGKTVKKTSSSDQIVDVIISMVRLKLVTFKFKKMSTRSRLLLDEWKIPSYCIVHDRSFRMQTHLDLICSCCIAAGLQDARLILCSHLGSCLA
nr:RNA-directed DNA polymerase, eukaryota, reverse transcriptase zinc-binding domain protein [Tanacetum cinerariifolium]